MNCRPEIAGSTLHNKVVLVVQTFVALGHTWVQAWMDRAFSSWIYNHIYLTNEKWKCTQNLYGGHQGMQQYQSTEQN